MYTGKDVEAVLSLYKNTMLSMREVARRTGVGRQTVYEWVQQAGLSRTRNASREISQEKKARAIELYNSGKSTREVALELGVSRTWVNRTMNAAGIMRSGSVATAMGQTVHCDATIVNVGTLREEGKTYRQISEITGVPMGTIPSLLSRFQALRKKERYKVRINTRRAA